MRRAFNQLTPLRPGSGMRRRSACAGPFLQQLFLLPGYANSIYRPMEGDGALDISDGKAHAVRIEVKDANGNKSVLETNVQYEPAALHQEAGGAPAGRVGGLL